MLKLNNNGWGRLMVWGIPALAFFLVVAISQISPHGPTKELIFVQVTKKSGAFNTAFHLYYT